MSNKIITKYQIELLNKKLELLDEKEKNIVEIFKLSNTLDQIILENLELDSFMLN